MELKNLNVDFFEVKRLLKLHRYEILDTPPEKTFEHIAILAAKIFDAPMAQINFVDDDRVFFKSNLTPVNISEIPRSNSFCQHTIQKTEVTLFEDTLNYPELSNITFVNMENGVRFYAGAPLKSKEGLQIGTVCVLDYNPKKVTENQLEMLQSLSEIVMDRLELRLNSRIVIRTQTDKMNRIVHDLKNPNTTIKLSAELIQLKANETETVKTLASKIITSSSSAINHINNLLDTSSIETGNYSIKFDPCSVNEILETVKCNLELVANSKNQVIHLNLEESLLINGDKMKLIELFENLISNALKFSHPNTSVEVEGTLSNDKVQISVTDSGLGLDEADKAKLFTKFAKLSSTPTGKEHSNGLGLFLVKTMAELHHGKVWATSPGKNKGSTFFISLPRAIAD